MSLLIHETIESENLVSMCRFIYVLAALLFVRICDLIKNTSDVCVCAFLE